MRRPHFLPSNKSNEQPHNAVWFDTETLPTIGPDGRQYHHLWFGWAAFQRRDVGGSWLSPDWFRFTSIDRFWSWIESKTRIKTRLHLFCHNGAFDLPVLHTFSTLPARGWTLRNAVVDAPPMMLQWRRDGRTLRFIDTLNIWRLPLDRIGEAVGIPKLPMPTPEASVEDWDRYCKRDVEVIRQAVLDWWAFLRENDLGGFAPTLASQAMRTYSHRFMPHKILVDDNANGLQVARDAYLGGRVECFKIGRYEGDFYYVDVNSMYPAVMREGLFPQRLLGVYGRPTLSEFRKWLTHRSVIADCTLETDEPAYPVVHEGRLNFPVGTFRATLCGPELSYALDHGHLKGSSRAAVFTQAPLFREFVDYFYGLKLEAQREGNATKRWHAKRIMNSLYGKFGQRGRRFETIGPDDPDRVEVWSEIDMDSGEVRHMRSFGGIIQEWRDEGESRDSMPAIAAYITSAARMALWEGILAAGRENVLYCDTDSMVISKSGLERILGRLDSERLGAWSVEDQFSTVTLFGPKDYIFGETRKTKGVRKNATWIAENAVSQDYFVGFRGLLREQSLDAPIVTRIEKHLRREYLKGDVDAEGNVSPFVFDQSASGAQWPISTF